jgi:hypothetical protein
MSVTSEADERSLLRVVEDYWARVWVMRIGVRTPELSARFAAFVQTELIKSDAWPPKHWQVLSFDTDTELDRLLPDFIEYLSEW